MSLSGPKVELRALQRSGRELEDRFLRPYLRATPTLLQPTRAEILDVAAFTVLLHGAIENFVEGVAYWVLGRTVRNWTTRKRTTRCTSSLLLYSPTPSGVPATTTVYDNLRNALHASKEAVSKNIETNHGITLGHLQDLFQPLGVDVPQDPTLTASLDRLVKMRHEWAHQFRYGAKVVKWASDAKVAADDCLKLAARISASARAAKP